MPQLIRHPGVLRLTLASALVAALATGAAGQTSTAPKASARAAPARPAPAPEPPPVAPTEQMKTSDDVKQGSVQGAATTPLRDLNVSKTRIPDILLQALANPYDRPPPKWKCPTLVALIRPLNEALGQDIDTLPAGDENLMDRGRSTALGVAGDIAASAIPFRGVVRKLSGAESHDNLVQSAIIAGNVRRGYLKGLGEAKGCSPPGTPSHERSGAAPIVDSQRPAFKPKFPTREPDEPQTSGGSPPAGPGKSRP
ncbi:hypothetical protein [Phenylobacterium sp.]|uniref:hypothetical protein n=1 Tax=Phenylobacterium sp. TaxID=1871053 RepID=UPI0025E97DA2|nr:hypothetical protein [Phenylobacterium sp.]